VANTVHFKNIIYVMEGRNMKGSKIFVSVLIAVLVLSAAASERTKQDAGNLSRVRSTAYDAGEFYRVGGQKIHLLRSLEKVAVRYTPTEGSSITSYLERNRDSEHQYIVDKNVSRFGITVLRTGKLESSDSLAESIRQLEQQPGIKRAAPVYIHQDSGLELVCTENLVVKLAAGATLTQMEAINKKMGTTIVKPISGTTDQFILALPNAKSEELLAACELYCQDPAIDWAEPDFLGQVVQYNNTSKPLLSNRYQYPWHLEKINVPQAWDTSTGGNIVIAILDDGADLTHEDLKENLPSNMDEIYGNGVDDDKNGYIDDYKGWDFFDNDNDPSHSNILDFHGTLVAGVAVAKGRHDPNVIGCAFNSRFMPLKVAKGVEFGLSSQTAEAILYAAGFTKNGQGRWRGADVINFSIGFSKFNIIDDALHRASKEGRNGKGCPIFCSVGNDASGYQWYAYDTSDLPSGNYFILFEYCKDSGGTDGEDTVWIGDVQLPDDYMTVVKFDSPTMPPGWSSEGDSVFNIVDDPNHAYGTGRYAARSGKIGGNQSSILKTQTFKLNRSNPFCFDAWVSSEKGDSRFPRYPLEGNDGDWLFIWFVNTDQMRMFGATADAGVPGDRWYDNFGYPVTTQISYPASHPDTIAVGASTEYDYRSDYSCYGPGLDFVAPSTGGLKYIATTDRTGMDGFDPGNYTDFFGGTSASAPISAGVAALMLSKNTNLTADRIRSIMQRSCTKIGPVQYNGIGWNQYYGYGLINAQYAVALADPRPFAMDVNDSTGISIPLTITLEAIDDGQPDPPGILTYIIDSLPAHGTLQDPGAELITVPNTSLVNNGNQVIYTPNADHVGVDSFTYKAYDGGIAPQGGYSNIATVSITTMGGTKKVFYVDSGYDDVYAWDSTNQNVNSPSLKVGYRSSGNPPFYMSGMRFNNINIPQDAIIVEARLRIHSYNEHLNDPVFAKIEGQADDNAGDLRDNNISTLPKTSASVNWDLDSAWLKNTWYTSPDIAGVIQEIISRPGWSEGNSLAVYYSTRMASGGYRYFSSCERSFFSYSPRLEITYFSP
jgi:subtilisin family serine protease